MIFSNKILRWGTLGVILASFLVSLNITAKRFSFEQKNRAIDVVMSLSDVELLAKQSGMSAKRLLSKLAYDKGVTSIAIEEDTIDSFINEGKVTLLKGSEIMNMLRVGKVYRTILTHLTKKTRIKKDRLYLVIDEYALYERIKNYLKLSLPSGSIKERGWNIIEVISNEDTLREIGLGISHKKVKTVTSYGFAAIPRIRNNNLLSTSLLNLKLDNVLKLTEPIHTIIFDGKSILGYPHHIKSVASQINNSAVNIGIIEFSSQRGANELARLIPNKVIKVHSISHDELEKTTPKPALIRYLRAAKERGNRILFLHPFTSYFGSDNLSTLNLSFITSIKQNLTEFGFQITAIKQIPTQGYYAANKLELTILTVGVLAWVLLFLNTLFPKKTNTHLIIIGVSFLSYLVCLLFQEPIAWSRFMTMIIACVFPAYAMIIFFPSYISEQNSLKRFGNCMIYLAKLLGISFIASLLIIGFTSDLSFLFNIRQFFGVKISFIFPLIVIGLYFYLRPHRILSIYYIFRRIFHSPITTSVLLAGFISILVISIYILRSGNYLTIPFLESWMRNTLESILFIRPRTKEFLIGYPFLIIGYMYVDRFLPRDWLWFFNVIGSIALISAINSFCHSHTPIDISFFRSIIGLCLGILFGLLYIFVFKSTRKLFKYISS